MPAGDMTITARWTETGSLSSSGRMTARMSRTPVPSISGAPWRSNGDGTPAAARPAAAPTSKTGSARRHPQLHPAGKLHPVRRQIRQDRPHPPRVPGEKLEAIAATAAANGRVECWHCTACDKYFADANGKTELTAENTVTERCRRASSRATTPDGKRAKAAPLTFRSNAAFEDFAEVLVDGAVLPSESYEKRNGEGNIIVELRESYLEQLAEGGAYFGHSLGKGDATTHFTVEAAPMKPIR